MILKKEREMITITKNPPYIGEPYKGKKESSTCFGSSCQDVIIGYRKGSKNPYLEKLSKMWQIMHKYWHYIKKETIPKYRNVNWDGFLFLYYFKGFV